ncbi:fructosamine kinase family protein [Aurantiacibacter sp. D1-12]|uniref:fructosamine kinase family protein n=1 Tax=Aurantiacibacter sp. D1-12 TaxID=2993658 RepID=UPI00237C5A96|nr:fructosamine kinase family protein [Aurantiacibacter sp. D1-12]MDE1467643.1 fructosamine kinase family protein [Aurantiacibacter sp. D1-12]
MSWQHRFESITGSSVAGGRKLAGGDLGGATLVDLADGRQMVAKSGPLVEREGEMLRAIARTGAPAPEVIHAERELLVMEYVEADGVKDWLSLADAMARLHAPRDELYGWDADYAFGKVTIPNARGDNWPAFWAENRLLCHAWHIDSSIARRLEQLAKRLPDLLPTYPTHSLLHGDLWGGNILFHRGEVAALIDPACYVGHREVDVAMLTLFDHPPHEFFEALHLEDGWRERLPIYRLWPLLVHLRLFGDGYRNSVTSALHTLGV